MIGSLYDYKYAISDISDGFSTGVPTIKQYKCIGRQQL